MQYDSECMNCYNDCCKYVKLNTNEIECQAKSVNEKKNE